VRRRTAIRIRDVMSAIGTAMDSVCPNVLSDEEVLDSPLGAPLSNGAADGEELDVVFVADGGPDIFAPCAVDLAAGLGLDFDASIEIHDILVDTVLAD
jgi:hypothetical protein